MEHKRICPICNNFKSLDKFISNSLEKCESCYKKQYYLKNRDKILQRSKERYIKLFSNRTDEIKKKACIDVARWRKNNPDKIKLANKRKYARVKADPERYRKQLEGSKKLHSERSYKESNQKYRDRSKQNLTDNYIKRTLLSHIIKLSYSDIPQELIDIKRKELKLINQLKEQSNGQSNQNI